MKIEVKLSTYGRGVFAKENIKAGEILEVAPIILIPKGDLQEIEYAPGKYELKKFRKNPIKDKDIQLSRYVFSWNDNLEAIALGYGSLYNHNPNPSVEQVRDYQNETITFKALKDVPLGEELYIDYGYDPTTYPSHEIVSKKVTATAKSS